MHCIKKFLKKLSVAILAMSVVVGVLPITAGAADTSQVKGDKAISIVTALNIMDSDGDGGELLTRQELAKVEARLKRIDVNLISQNLTGNASYSDAIKVIVTALGYDIAVSVTDNDDWYRMALKLKVLNGVREANGNITRENMAIMIYNALESEMLIPRHQSEKTEYIIDTDKTLLESVFNAVHDKGIITQTPYSTHTANNSNHRTVYIDDVVYVDRLGLVPSSYLGYYVDFYAVENDDDEYEVIWLKKRDFKNDAITVQAEDISDKSTREQMIYTNIATNSEKKVNIPSDAVIIYNGIPTSNISNIYPEYGSVTVLDSDYDGRYDCVIIEAYEVMRAEYIDTKNETIYDYENNFTLDLSRVGMYEVFKDGKLGTLATVSKNDTLLLAPSYYSFGNSISDAETIAIYASNYKIRGIVEQIGKDYIYVNDAKYKISDDAREELQTGIYVELELDYFGRVSRCTPATAMNNYGYILSYGPEDWDNEKAVYVRIFTQDGEMKVFNLNDSIIYSGYLANGTYTEQSKISNGTFLNLLKNGAEAMNEVVTYTVNTDGTIKSIRFADTSKVNDPMADNKSVLMKNYDQTSVKARSVFVGTSYRVDSQTLIFRVPSGGYSHNDDDYSIYSTTNFEETTFSHVKVYNASENKIAGVIVLESDDGDEPSEVIGNNVFVIDSIGASKNSDGDRVVLLSGIQAGVYKDIAFAKESMEVGGGKWYNTRKKTSDDLQVGDVIQYGVDSNGYINAYQVLFAPSEQVFSSNKSVARDNQGYLSGLNTIEGRVTDSNGRSIMVDGIDFSILTSEGSITVVNDGKAEAGNPASIEVGDYVFIRCNRLYARDIVVYK
ncbi:MAG: hypothetical protein IJT23_08385 [Clostridia bacterium]|nr:hypothetical protein [Clostridia bacterium]